MKNQSTVFMESVESKENLLMLKSNILVDSWFDANLSEYMLIQCSLFIVTQMNEKNEYYDANTNFRLTTQDFCEIWGYENNSKNGGVTHILKDAAMSLMRKGFWYKDYESLKPVFSYWFSQISPLESGCLNFSFPPALIPYLKQINKKFTWYDLRQIQKLKRVYSIRLYEIFAQNKYLIGKSTSKSIVEKNEITISVEDIRSRFVLEKKYPVMADFKRHVIELPIQQINEHTNLNVSYEPIKKGRKIVAFKFKYKFQRKDLDFRSAVKSKDDQKMEDIRDRDAPDMFYQLTEKQIAFFSKKLAYSDDFGAKFAEIGESILDFEKRIANNLRDFEYIKKIKCYLEAVGYKEK